MASDLIEAESQGADAKESKPAPAARQQLQVNDSHAVACYANFCRVTGTPEELIIDFGLNNQPMGIPPNLWPSRNGSS